MYVDSNGTVAGFIFQAFVSTVSYIGIAIASIWDEEICADMNAINWNPFNSNADMSNVNKVSFYKGQAVIIQDFASFSFSFGIMGLHTRDKNDITTVNHEWCHFVQLGIHGPVDFLMLI